MFCVPSPISCNEKGKKDRGELMFGLRIVCESFTFPSNTISLLAEISSVTDTKTLCLQTLDFVAY